MHQVQAGLGAVHQVIVVGEGVVFGGVLGDGDDGGTLRCIELADILAVVEVGSRLDAGGVVSKADGVEVYLDDLLLGIVLFQLHGAEDLLGLADNGEVVVMSDVLDHLLGDGGAAGCALIDGHHQVDSRGNGTLPVHALVFPEALVLQSNGGIDQVIRDLIVVHPDAVYIAVQPLHFHVVAAGVLAIENGGIAHLGGTEVHNRFVGNVLEYVDSQRTADDTGGNYSDAQSDPQVIPYFREPLQPVWFCGFCHVQNLLLYRDTGHTARQTAPGLPVPVWTRCSFPKGRTDAVLTAGSRPN